MPYAADSMGAQFSFPSKIGPRQQNQRIIAKIAVNSLSFLCNVLFDPTEHR